MSGMRYSRLPEPPEGRAGWPWTQDVPVTFGTMKNGRPWPRITVVTPSYNQGRFIEETIRSVLLQGYPDLEYIIMDGGSTDETLDVIRRYSRWITSWESRPDAGQSDAINKGFARATGEIFAYINSDDLYEPGAFFYAAELLAHKPAAGFMAGACRVFGIESRIFYPSWPDDPAELLAPFGSPFAQPSFFFTKEAYKKVGGFDPSLHYVFDREFYIRLALAGYTPLLTDRILARYRYHDCVKTRNTIKFYKESIPVVQRYGRSCGLSPVRIRGLIVSIENDIAYLETFRTWREESRVSAFLYFMRRFCTHPSFIADRKVMGLARRLLTFPESKVAELQE